MNYGNTKKNSKLFTKKVYNASSSITLQTNLQCGINCIRAANNDKAFVAWCLHIFLVKHIKPFYITDYVIF